jgi:hypothetical protein
VAGAVVIGVVSVPVDGAAGVVMAGSVTGLSTTGVLFTVVDVVDGPELAEKTR